MGPRQASKSHRQPRTIGLPRWRCHNVVTSRCEWGELTGDGLRPFVLVTQLLKPLQYSGIRAKSDWGSSGRRFKSCQPDQKKRLWPAITQSLSPTVA